MFPIVLSVSPGQEERLKKALEAIYQNDPMMRTRIFKHGDDHYQVVVKQTIEWRQDPGPLEEYLAYKNWQSPQLGEPLCIYTIVRASDKIHIVWEIGHALTDRTARSALIKLLGRYWEDPTTSAEIAPPIRQLIHHTKTTQHREEGFRFWRDRMHGHPRLDVFHERSLKPMSERGVQMTKIHNLGTAYTPGIAPATIAHLAWALVLARSSGLADLVFTSVSSGRQLPVENADKMSGPLVTRVPFRATFSNPQQPLKQLLQDIQRDLVCGFPHDHVGPEAISRYLQGTQSEGRCFVQSTFAHNSEEMVSSNTFGSVDLCGAGGSLKAVCKPFQGKLPLSASLYTAVSRDIIVAIHDPELVSQKKVSELVDDLIHTIDHLRRSTPWDGIVLGDLLPKDLFKACYSQMELQAKPKTLANVLPSESNSLCIIAPRSDTSVFMDQNQFRKCIEDFQSQIAPLNLASSSVVILALPNSLEFMVAFLGLANMRLIVAPINPALKKQEVDFEIEDTSAKLVILPMGSSESDNAAASSAKDKDVIAAQFCFQNSEVKVKFSSEAARELQGNQHHISDSHEDDVTLILHTSGTTGRPKSVPLTHKNLITSADNIVRAYNLSAIDRTMLIMPLYHIHGIVASFLSTLRSGGTVIVPPKLEPSFWSHFQEYNVTLESANQPTFHKIQLFSTHTCTIPSSRGEAAMTEASHLMMSNPLPPAQRKPGSVGLPQGVELEIKDAEGKAVSAGKEGEVCIRGKNVTKGYLDNPDANQSAFCSDGFFRTGDQGRLDNDGYLILTGRLKEFINKGGEKISPIEVDNVLIQHEDVEEVVCFAMDDDMYGQEVGAAVRPKRGKEVDTGALRKWLSSRIAAHKLPKKIWLLDEIPKTSTGKVQRALVAEHVTAK